MSEKPVKLDRCWLRLANGWTVSITPNDTPPALCAIAAWPTRLDNSRHAEADLFAFKNGRADGAQGRTDCRCWVFADVRAALKEISTAIDPKTDANLMSLQQEKRE